MPPNTINTHFDGVNLQVGAKAAAVLAEAKRARMMALENFMVK
jgi:hypothetical protein